MKTASNMVIVLSVCTQIALGQSAASDWARVEATKKGDQVRIETADKKKHRGVFVSASGTDVSATLRDGAQVNVPKSDVRRVYIQSKSRRLRNTIIGTAVGVAVGIALYATVGQYFRNEGQGGSEAMLIAPIAAGAALGALPSSRMQKIYDANHK